MATAVAERKAAQSSASSLLPRFQGIFGKGGLLDEHNVERTDEIEILALAVLAGVDALFLGDPGVGKTYMLELFTDYGLKDCTLYNQMVFKESGVDELLGPRSIQGLKSDEIRRIMAGFLPEADTAVIDEVFKGSPAVLNAMLDLFASRTLKVGGKKIDCSQLITIMMASNELPEREDINPFRDRIGFTKEVAPVKSPTGLKRVAEIQIGHIKGGIKTSIEPLALGEVQEARAEVDAIEIPDTLIDTLVEAQQEWLQAKHAPSQRRMKQMYKVVKAHAWLAGRTQAGADDLLPLQHMSFNNLDDRDSARKVIMKHTSAFLRKAQQFREGVLAPLFAELDTMKNELEAAPNEAGRDAILARGFEYVKKIRKLKSEGNTLLEEGKKHGQDVTTLEAALVELEAARKWARKELYGTEDED